jgi:hypothetical protein
MHLQRHIDAWNDAHSALTRALRSSLLLVERLCLLNARSLAAAGTPPLRDPLSHLYPYLLHRLHEKLERTHAIVQDALDEVETSAASMASIQRQATHMVTRLKGSQAMLEYSLGPVPSIQTCLDGISAIVDMYRRETAVCRWGAGKSMLDALAYLGVEGSDTQASRPSVMIESSGSRDEAYSGLEVYRKIIEVVERKGCVDSHRGDVAQKMHVVFATMEAK